MDREQRDNWHERLAAKLERACDAGNCETEPTRVRNRISPIWAMDLDGATELSEEDFLSEVSDLLNPDEAEFEPSFQLDQIQVLCLEHFQSRRRNLEKPDRPGDSGAGPTENKLVEAKDRRQVVLARLGNACADCGTRDVSLLQVALKPDQPVDAWAAIGVRGWLDKYEALASQESLLSIVDCVCGSCAQVRTSPKRSLTKVTLRERVIEGYGGLCGVCSVEVDNRTAWLVRLQGTEAMRHAGGAGRKLTSRQKYQRLLKDGCPAGWELRCPAHQKTSN